MPFSVENINLTSRDVDGNILTANVYRLDGIDRQLSMGQLVVAICLQRAAELESHLISLMEDMAENSEKLTQMTNIQDALVTWIDTASVNSTLSRDLSAYLADFTIGDVTYKANGVGPNTWLSFLTDVCGMDPAAIPSTGALTYAEVQELISALSENMDSLNSVSQEQLIEMQSTTNKRDQTYNLITNMTKSLHTTMMGISNNI